MNAYESFAEVATIDLRDGTRSIYLGEVLTWVDLFGGVECLSTGLNSLGIKQRDKIILYMPNTPQWIISWLSIQKIGAVAVPIAPIYTAQRSEIYSR